MKIKNWIKNHSFELVLFVVFIIFVLIIQRFLSPIYVSPDDIAFKSFLSGNKTGVPEAHLYFIQYPLSFFLAQLYEIAGSIDWYGLFLLCSTVFPLYFLIIKLRKLNNGNLCLILLVAISYILLLYKYMLQLEWSVVSSILILSGILYLFLDWNNQEKASKIGISYIPGYVMILLGINLRIEMFYMILPLLFCIFIIQIIKFELFSIKKLLNMKRIVIPYLIICSLFGVTYVSNKMAYNTKEWKEFSTYSVYRSRIRDFYGFPDFDEYRTEYEDLGIDELKYEILKYDYNALFLNQELTIDDYEKLYHLSEKAFWSEMTIGERILDTIDTGYEKLTDSVYFSFNLIIIALFLIVSFVLVYDDKKKYIFIESMCLCIYMMAWMAFQFLNRLPERVGIGILLCVLVFLVLLLSGVNKSHFFNRNRFIVSFVPLLIFFCFHCLSTHVQMEEMYLSCQDREEVVEYYRQNDNKIFLRDFSSFNSMGEKITSINSKKNINELTLGGWNVGSPVYSQQLKVLGCNSFDDLLKKDNLYFVVDRSTSKYIVKRFRSLLEQYNKEITFYNQLDLSSGREIGIFKID